MNFYEFEQILEQDRLKFVYWNKHPKGSEEYEKSKKLADKFRVSMKSRKTGKSVEEIRKEEEKEKIRIANIKKKLSAKRPKS